MFLEPVEEGRVELGQPVLAHEHDDHKVRVDLAARVGLVPHRHPAVLLLAYRRKRLIEHVVERGLDRVVEILDGNCAAIAGIGDDLGGELDVILLAGVVALEGAAVQALDVGSLLVVLHYPLADLLHDRVLLNREQQVPGLDLFDVAGDDLLG